MTELETKIVTMSNMFKTDEIFGYEVRKMVNELKLREVRKERIDMNSLKLDIDKIKKTYE